jgi:aerobic-type carbon monoxide dehydrogenase small subunit (CoxS/CutS family)
MISLKINGRNYDLDADPEMPLLWAVRDLAGLTGTKYGCGIAICGACTLYLDGQPVRSCVTPLSAADGKSVTTIEGLSGKVAEAVMDAWLAEDVPQCGYCQPGQVVEAVALLSKNPKPSDAEVTQAMAGHLCRCGTYSRIRKAIAQASTVLAPPTLIG